MANVGFNSFYRSRRAEVGEHVRDAQGFRWLVVGIGPKGYTVADDRPQHTNSSKLLPFDEAHREGTL